MSTARNLESLVDPATAALPAGGLQTGIVYGPFTTPNNGTALGLNILGAVHKVCAFDCPYCDLGTTELRLNKVKRDVEFPTPTEIKTALIEKLRDLHENGPACESICISGNGEPTLHPDFPEVVQAILEARDLWAAGRPVYVLSSGANLESRKVIEALNLLDERVIKIDAGNEKLFKQLNAPLSRMTLSRVIDGLRGLKDCSVQSLFVKGIVSNTAPTDIDDWVEVIALIKPKQVYISTITRQPAVMGVLCVDENTLYMIASRLERKTQMRAVVAT
jgi:wyosine [tRNA(Phe)-imidazoG37] synthetase (radical SAM superfamily)